MKISKRMLKQIIQEELADEAERAKAFAQKGTDFMSQAQPMMTQLAQLKKGPESLGGEWQSTAELPEQFSDMAAMMDKMKTMQSAAGETVGSLEEKVASLEEKLDSVSEFLGKALRLLSQRMDNAPWRIPGEGYQRPPGVTVDDDPAFEGQPARRGAETEMNENVISMRSIRQMVLEETRRKR